ncbi:MAG: Hsp20/alpha crystallin family protein [Candidatus Omnitrophica bacterium]|nr:Hsp20/alpha crystallin family protein [Candidatus Omnitrophota bacterium]
MKTLNLKSHLPGVLILSLLLFVHPVFAQENVQDLKAEIQELKTKVAQLEAQQNNMEQKQFPAVGEDSGWDPFVEMQRIHEQMGHMFNQAWGQSMSPRVGMFSNQMYFDNSQIEETKDGYMIKLDIAGFDKDKIDIKLENHSISISGEYKKDEKQEHQKTAFESHSYGKFLNTIPLPKDADTSKMKTEKKGDQLEIYLPKRK